MGETYDYSKEGTPDDPWYDGPSSNRSNLRKALPSPRPIKPDVKKYFLISEDDKQRLDAMCASMTPKCEIATLLNNAIQTIEWIADQQFKGHTIVSRSSASWKNVFPDDEAPAIRLAEMVDHAPQDSSKSALEVSFSVDDWHRFEAAYKTTKHQNPCTIPCGRNSSPKLGCGRNSAGKRSLGA